MSKNWEMAKNQFDPKENVDLINDQLYTTFYYLILLNDTTLNIWRFFASEVHLILKAWLNISKKYISGTSMKPMRCSGNPP